MKEIEAEDVISVGDHIIVQRLDFKKVYKVSETGSLAMGKEEIKMSAIIGKPFWTKFKIVPCVNNKKSNKKRISTLVVAEETETLEDLRNSLPSGIDNRSIKDDGKSQKLSKDDILSLRDSGKSGREIVSSLIENNASFTEKTEYSQEKYIRKKEKKYCEFLTVLKPTLPDLQEIYLRQDVVKIYGIRIDALAQILAYSNIRAEGNYILYDSGTAGLVSAGLLSRIGTNTTGNLVYLHSGDSLPQLPILRAMNFKQDQFDRLHIARIFDFLALIKKEKAEVEITLESKQSKNGDTNAEIGNNEKNIQKSNDVEHTVDLEKVESCEALECNELKRKSDDSPSDEPAKKKSRKIIDLENAVETIHNNKADGLVIVAKEHPLNIVESLLPHLKASRPFVIYHMHREPLQETYVALKYNNSVVNVKLFSNFFRAYQILPDRTHPEILTNDSGGYILTGFLVS